MSNRLRPLVGHWYNHLDKGDLFQVVALDEDYGTIEIQEFDGGLDEIDLEEWRQMDIESAAAPEDWSGPVDELEPDDLGYTDIPREERQGPPLEGIAGLEDLLAEEEEPEPDAPRHRPSLRQPRTPRRPH